MFRFVIASGMEIDGGRKCGSINEQIRNEVFRCGLGGGSATNTYKTQIIELNIIQGIMAIIVINAHQYPGSPLTR